MTVRGTFHRPATVANLRLDITQWVDRVAENRWRPCLVGACRLEGDGAIGAYGSGSHALSLGCT